MAGRPSMVTDEDPGPNMMAAQCISHPFFPQHGWGVTRVPGCAKKRPLTLTVDDVGHTAAPPAVFMSPCLTIAAICLSL